MKKHNNMNSVFFAILLIVIGLLILVNNFTNIQIDLNLSKLWPLILIFIGINKLFSDGSDNGFSIIMILIGSLFLLNNFGYLDKFNFNISDLFWPAILIIIGVNILIKRTKFTKDKQRNIIADKSEEFDYFTIFSGSKNRINSNNLKSGKAIAVFGGLEIDLLSANNKENKIVIDLTVIFGGIELKIPSNWNIIQKGMPIFGGFSDKRIGKDHNSENAPTVFLYTNILFGGITIKN